MEAARNSHNARNTNRSIWRGGGEKRFGREEAHVQEGKTEWEEGGTGSPAWLREKKGDPEKNFWFVYVPWRGEFEKKTALAKGYDQESLAQDLHEEGKTDGHIVGGTYHSIFIRKEGHAEYAGRWCPGSKRSRVGPTEEGACSIWERVSTLKRGVRGGGQSFRRKNPRCVGREG